MSLGGMASLGPTASASAAGGQFNSLSGLQGLDLWVLLLLLAALGRSNCNSANNDPLAFLAGMAVGMQIDVGMGGVFNSMGSAVTAGTVTGATFDALA